MLGIEAVAGTLMVPIWGVGAASAIFVGAIVMAIGRAGAVTAINALSRVVIVAIAIFAGWFYTERTEQLAQTAERRLLDERATALMARAIAPGSALSCLDEIAGETVEIACEKAVFASPEAVAAAVTYITAKLALLADGSDLARRTDGAFAAEFVQLRTAIELDRFGIVAHVLANRHGCTEDKCDALMQFSDHTHVVANLRDHTFDEHVTTFAANWNDPPRAAPDRAVAATPVPVSPRYDFPSSQSIPAVNIMVPEPGAPRAGSASGTQPTAAPGEANSRATPVPPRRPPPVRAPPTAAGARPSSPQPSAPIAVGEAPPDGAVPRPSATIPQQ
jgi:hypothetical protein